MWNPHKARPASSGRPPTNGRTAKCGSGTRRFTPWAGDTSIVKWEATRPEYLYFEAETQKIESLAHLQKVKNFPKLYAYGQAGYSYPGLNFFENQSDYYYIIGAKLSWTIFNWKQTGRETEIIRKQKDIVETKRKDFNRKLAISLIKEQIEQEKLQQIIDMDDKIIGQREDGKVLKGRKGLLKKN